WGTLPWTKLLSRASRDATDCDVCGTRREETSRRRGLRGGDGDARGLAARGRLHADLENSVAVLRRDGFGVDRTGPPERALEAAVAYLAIGAPGFGLLALRLALALDGQSIARHGNVDGFGVDPR